MINPIPLPENNEIAAQEMFKEWLKKQYTFIVVFDTGHEAELALSKANEKINSGSVNYADVRAIHAPTPGFIISILSQLKVNPNLPAIDWGQPGQYTILSITNKYNNIAGIVKTADAAVNTGGKINQLVLAAFAMDKPLD